MVTKVVWTKELIACVEAVKAHGPITVARAQQIAGVEVWGLGMRLRSWDGHHQDLQTDRLGRWGPRVVAGVGGEVAGVRRAEFRPLRGYDLWDRPMREGALEFKGYPSRVV